MNYEAFKSLLLDQVSHQIGPGYHISIRPVLKNNGIRLDSLLILSPGQLSTPSIYLSPLYQAYCQGGTMEEAAQTVLRLYHSRRPDDSFRLEALKSLPGIQSQISFRLVNYEENMELLSLLPHRSFLDLAVIYCVRLEDPVYGPGSCVVTTKHTDLWEVSEDKLWDLACQNSPSLYPCTLRSMESVLKSFLNSANRPEPAASGLYVLSNTEGFYGASCILYRNILSDFAEQVESDLYLLPSSVHEFLLLPVRRALVTPEQISDMVKDINENEVAPDDRLSDHIYLFSRESKEIISL